MNGQRKQKQYEIKYQTKKILKIKIIQCVQNTYIIPYTRIPARICTCTHMNMHTHTENGTITIHKNIKGMILCLERLVKYLNKWFSLFITAIGWFLMSCQPCETLRTGPVPGKGTIECCHLYMQLMKIQV